MGKDSDRNKEFPYTVCVYINIHINLESGGIPTALLIRVLGRIPRYFHEEVCFLLGLKSWERKSKRVQEGENPT